MTTQLNLFNQPTLNVLRDVKTAMSLAADGCGLSREEIVDNMNQLADRYGVRLIKGNGKQLSIATLDKWLNPADTIRVISVKALPIFCTVVGSVEPMRCMIEPLGWQVIDEKKAKLLAWAEHYQAAKSARVEMRKLEPEL